MSDFTRREFLGAAAAGGALLAGQLAVAAPAADSQPLPKVPPAKIYTIFAGLTGDSYLQQPTEQRAKIQGHLAETEKRLGNIQLVGGDLLPPAKLEELVPKLKGADGLLIVHLSGHMHGGDTSAISKLIDVGLPTAVFSQPFSGHSWMYFPQWHKQGKKVVVVPSSDWNDLDRVAGLLRVPGSMKKTRIIAIGGPHGSAAACVAENVRKKLGAELVVVPNDRVMAIFKSIDTKLAEAEAQDYWLSKAKALVEPKPPEVVESARLFLAIKKLMIEENAQAVCSVHCMGNPRACLTFSKLNDLGFVGACEGDIDSTLTMLLFNYAFGVPGFISDPVVDVSKNALIHFHCTSATKMDGPCGKRLPFSIRTQTDSRGGVALEVENRVGQPVTCAKLVNLDTMLMVPGKIIETSKSPLACRTQFTQSVPDARRLFLNWGGDVIKGDTMTLLHRAVFYGDYMKPMQDLGDLMGFKVVEEGGA